MKKLLSLLAMVGFSLIANAQCISGPEVLYTGQTYTFTSVSTAQCTSCYDWDINGNTTSSDNQVVGNAQIIGSDQGQTVSIKPLVAGCFTVSLTYFDETNCHTCKPVTFCAVDPTPLPATNCFGFDPVQPSDVTSQGTMNYGYLGSPYAAPLPDAGLSFTWYFKFQDGTLLTFYVQNPTFRELCPDNPVKSFACVVSNGVTTKTYKSIVSGYPIPGISGANSPTCFIHPDCSLGFRMANPEIKVSPNPTSSTIKFDGENLSNYTISIFNSNGTEIIKDAKIDTNISLEKQQKGIYLYIITDANGFRQEGKIIKE